MELFGLIGAGNMGGAIAKGIKASGLAPAGKITVFDVDEPKRLEMANLGFATAWDESEVVQKSKYVILAVKPQDFACLLQNIKCAVTAETVIVTIAAGISIESIQEALGGCKVIRVMPNTPLLLGCGASAVSRSANVTDEEFDFILKLFDSLGKAKIIDASLMNEVIPLNGSAPAFIYLFAKYFVERAVQSGIDKETANELFCQSLIGSSRMMTESGFDHDTLIKMVTSKGGTTEKGLAALERNGLKQAVFEAYDDCVKRAYELGK